MTIVPAMFRRLVVTFVAGIAVSAAVAFPAWPLPSSSPRDLPAVGAQTPAFDFGIEPYNAPGTEKRSAFNLDGPVGATINDRVELVNSGPTPQQFQLYPARAYTIEEGGGFGLNLRTDPRADIASWITLPVTTYLVPGRSAALIPMRLSIPSDASPGDHTAGIVAEQVVAPGQVKSGEGVTVVHRVAARVYLRVGGPVHAALRIQQLVLTHRLPINPIAARHTETLVNVLVKNTGNARVALSSISITMTGLFGRQIHKLELTTKNPTGPSASTEVLPAQILPAGQVRLRAPFTGLPPLDHVTVDVGVVGADAVAATPVTTKASGSFWVVPWLAVILVVLLIVGYLLFRRWYLRRRRARSQPGPDVAGTGAQAEPPVWVPARS